MYVAILTPLSSHLAGLDLSRHHQQEHRVSASKITVRCRQRFSHGACVLCCLETHSGRTLTTPKPEGALQLKLCLMKMSRHPPVGHFAGDAPPIDPYIPPGLLYPWPTGPPNVSRPGQYPSVHSYFPSPQAHSGYAVTPPRFGFHTSRGTPPRRMPQKRFRGPYSLENPPHQKQFHRRKVSSHERSLFDRDDPFYDISMFEDPWKDFFPVSTEEMVKDGVCSDTRLLSDHDPSLCSLKDSEVSKPGNHSLDTSRDTEVRTCQDWT